MTRKPHPLKGRKVDPLVVAKRMETMRLRRIAKQSGAPAPLDERVHDAVLYLRNAERAFLKDHRRLSNAELLALLALRTLEGSV